MPIAPDKDLPIITAEIQSEFELSPEDGEQVVRAEGYDIHITTDGRGEMHVSLKKGGEEVRQFCCEILGPDFFDADVAENDGVVDFGIVATRGHFRIGIDIDSY